MLLAIMRYYEVAPDDTLMVGNAEADRGAAGSAGTAFMWAGELFAGFTRR